MNLFGRVQPPAPVRSGEGPARVFGKPGLETEVSGHARGGFDGIVRDDAGDDQDVVSGSTEGFFEAGADKRAVGLLGNYQLARQRLGLRFEVVSRLARPVGGSGVAGVVADVVDREFGLPPGLEQLSDVALRVAIVAPAMTSPADVVYRFLHVDQEQGRLVHLDRLSQLRPSQGMLLALAAFRALRHLPHAKLACARDNVNYCLVFPMGISLHRIFLTRRFV